MNSQGWAYAILDGPHGQGRIAYGEHGAMIFYQLRTARRRLLGLPHPGTWSIVRVHMETEPFALAGNGRGRVASEGGQSNA